MSFYDELPFIYCRENAHDTQKNKHSLTEYQSVNEKSECYDEEEVHFLCITSHPIKVLPFEIFLSF